MSDTSIISTASSYKNHNNENSSCCARYWFSIINSFLLLIIVITSVLLIYFLNKQAERDRERQRIKDEFKRKYGVANKILDMIMKDGIIYKWIKAHKGSLATTFKELFKDIGETLSMNNKKPREIKKQYIICVLVYHSVIFKMCQSKRNNDDDEGSWVGQNIVKLIIIVCLTIIAIGCSATLAVVLMKQIQRERVLQTKKSTWSTRLEECAPILKVVGPIILNIIKVAFSILLI